MASFRLRAALAAVCLALFGAVALAGPEGEAFYGAAGRDRCGGAPALRRRQRAGVPRDHRQRP